MYNLLMQLLPIVIIIAIFFFLIRALIVSTVMQIRKSSSTFPGDNSDKFTDIFRAINDIAATQQHIESKIVSIEARLLGIEKKLTETPS